MKKKPTPTTTNPKGTTTTNPKSDGKVKFERVGRDRKQVSIYAVEQ